MSALAAIWEDAALASFQLTSLEQAALRKRARVRRRGRRPIWDHALRDLAWAYGVLAHA